MLGVNKDLEKHQDAMKLFLDGKVFGKHWKLEISRADKWHFKERKYTKG